MKIQTVRRVHLSGISFFDAIFELGATFKTPLFRYVGEEGKKMTVNGESN